MDSDIKKLQEKIKSLEKDLKKFKAQLEEVDCYERMQQLFDNSQDPILVIDEYNFIECNAAAVNTLLYTSSKELLEIHPSKLSPEYQPDGELSFDKAQRMMDIAYSKGYHRFEWIHQTKNYKQFWVDVALTRIHYQGKDMLFTLWRDISKRKEFEKDLTLSRKSYSTLFDQAADGILVGIGDGEIVNANQSILELTQYSKDELIGMNISLLFEKESLSGTPLRYDLVRKGQSVISERNILRKDGKKVPIEMSTKILEDGRMQALFRDISERKQSEEKLRKNQELLNKAETVAGLGRYYYDVKLDEWESSDILDKIFGINKDYKRNFKNWIEIIHPEHKTEMLNYFKYNILENGETFDKEYRIIRINDKQERWLHGYGEIEYDKDKLPHHVLGTIQDITERKQAEIALKNSESKYKSIFENSAFGIIHFDTNAIITDCNNQFVKIIGSTKEKLLGLNMYTDINNEKLSRTIKEALLSGYGYFEDWYSSVTAVKNTYVRTKFTHIKDTTGKVISGIGLVEDITEQKLNDLKIKENQLMIERITEQTPNIIYIYDLKSNSNIFINKDLNTYLGYKKNEISEDSLEIINKLIHPDDYKQFHNYEKQIRAWESKYIKEFEYRLKDANGNWRWFLGREKEFQRDNGVITTIIGVVTDITERKMALQQLIESKEKFESIAMLLPEVVYETDLQGNLTFVNLKAFEIFGYTQDEFNKGLSIFQMLAPEEIKRAQAEFSKISPEYKAVGKKYIALTKSGHKFPILIYGALVKKEDKITGLRGIIVNIENLTKAEDELRKSEEKFRLLFENSMDAILIADKKGILDCNSKMVEMFRAKNKEEIFRQNQIQLSPEYQPDGSKSDEKSFDIIKEVLNGESKYFEWMHKRLDGSLFYAEISIIPFKIGGRLIIQSIIRDISERKEVEQRIYDAIVQTEETERQRLASDIHDDIGPLLSSLKMYIESLNNSDDPQKQAFLKSKLQSLIVESINNVREVSNALSPYLLNKYGLKTAINGFINNLEEIIEIDFETNIEKKRFDIKYETVFYRVVKELINNTLKHSKADLVSISLNYSQSELVLVYEDNGIGIKKGKTNKKESGMGLLNITNRIQSINGRYRYYKPENGGFGFELISRVKIHKN